MRDSQKKGFSLIELMITLALVAILIVIAVSSYGMFVDRARRADAQTALAGLGTAMQRYYTESSPSTFVGASLGSGGIYASEAPLDGATKYYTLAISSSSSTAYTVTATPKNAQAGDKCGVLSLTSTGVRSISGGSAGITWQDCWR